MGAPPPQETNGASCGEGAVRWYVASLSSGAGAGRPEPPQPRVSLGRRRGALAGAVPLRAVLRLAEEDGDLLVHLAVLGALDELLELLDRGLQVQGATATGRVDEDVAEVLPFLAVAVLVRRVGDLHQRAWLLR